MSTATKNRTGAIEPDRLYTFEELADLTGLSARRIKRVVDDGRLGHVLIGEERGRLVEGQQWLDFKASRRVKPVA